MALKPKVFHPYQLHIVEGLKNTLLARVIKKKDPWHEGDAIVTATSEEVRKSSSTELYDFEVQKKLAALLAEKAKEASISNVFLPRNHRDNDTTNKLESPTDLMGYFIEAFRRESITVDIYNVQKHWRRWKIAAINERHFRDKNLKWVPKPVRKF